MCGAVLAMERIVDVADDGETGVLHLLAHPGVVDCGDARQIFSARKDVALIAIEKLIAKGCEDACGAVVGGAAANAQHNVLETPMNGIKNHLTSAQCGCSHRVAQLRWHEPEPACRRQFHDGRAVLVIG